MSTNRRRFLGLLGAAGLGALAGCETSGGSGAGTATPTPDAVPGPTDQAAKFTAADIDRDDDFGGSVALSAEGDTALLGAGYDEDPNGEGAGAAYVFE